MNLLLDECIDWRFARESGTGHLIKTVPQKGWAGIKNGELLRLAEVEFDVLITVDRNLTFQQNVPKFNIAVLILHAPSNRLADLKPLAPKSPQFFPNWSKVKSRTSPEEPVTALFRASVRLQSASYKAGSAKVVLLVFCDDWKQVWESKGNLNGALSED